MNNKLGFILPRVFGLAIIAGIASFLLAMVAKILIGAAVIGTIVMAVKSGINRRRGHQQGMYGMQNYNDRHLGATPFYQNSPMAMNMQQRSNGIIPIN